MYFLVHVSFLGSALENIPKCFLARSAQRPHSTAGRDQKRHGLLGGKIDAVAAASTRPGLPTARAATLDVLVTARDDGVAALPDFTLDLLLLS